jgi:acetylornithine deacetylase
MNALEYASDLIRFDSTWYRSNRDVVDYCEQVLRKLGCETERIEYVDEDGVAKSNVIARKGSGSGGLAYFGHTDVVTTEDWSITEHGAFEPTVVGDRLYGRGSTDMKGSIACMFAALESLGDQDLAHPVYISCSSDEEVNHRGAVEIATQSQIYNELVEGQAKGVVGEPTSLDPVYAHKGGCRITIKSRGRAAHSSTREGINANLAMIPFLVELKAIRDETESDPAWANDEFDPPTVCLNIGINDHTTATNITPPQSICTVSFRPMPGTDAESILDRIRTAAEKNGIEYVLENHHVAFRRDPQSEFSKVCGEVTGGEPRTVAYGSEASNFPGISDLIVLGPGNITEAHKSDEWISLAQLEKGEQTYRELIRRFCV